MATQQRIQYHWIEDRLVERQLLRPTHTSVWRFGRPLHTLVATIEPRERSFNLREGPAATPERIVDCVRYYKGVLVDHSARDFSGLMPLPIREELQSVLNTTISSALRQWQTFAEETDITGYLKGELSKVALQSDGWKVAVKAWTYKRNPKEKILGVDLGVIFDLLYNNERVLSTGQKFDHGLPSFKVKA